MPSLLHLTPVHSSIYEFIIKYKIEHDGLAPSVLEIGEACGVNSTSMVRHYLNTLDLLGMIKCDYVNGRSRMISVPGARWIPPSDCGISSPISRAEHAGSGSSITE